MRSQPYPGGISAEHLQQYGGQAVIEGVMMRSPRYFAVACRRPDGRIEVEREEVDRSILGRLKWLNRPFLRGILALLDAMILGARALTFSSSIQMAEAAPAATAVPVQPVTEQSKPQPDLTAQASPAPAVVRRESSAPATRRINDIAVGGALLFSFLVGLVLFKLVPTLITGWFQMHAAIGEHANPHTLNAIDGLIRLAIFFGYILLISRMEQIRRVFMYHGAEHKAINTLEAGRPLTVESSLTSSRIHPRCGTSFIFVVLLIDLVVVALLWRPQNLFVRFALQAAVIPVVAGIGYEVIKLAGRYRKHPVLMAVFGPGMATQYLTTREPDASQVEVALAALWSVLEAEGHFPETAAEEAEIREEEPAAAVV